ncbi:MAG: glycosyltransferase family 4 protein [Rhizobium rhizophilum]|uniref:glycosyltransferase family 4 protein n=1 Tax=Rhizobium rhizophilum TaxID=1850373 RepID=UPI00391B478A
MERMTASGPSAVTGLAKGARIVQIVRQYTPSRGGLEDVVSNLSRSLVARGFVVRVVTLDRLFRAPDEVLPSREVIDGVDVIRIPWCGSSRYPLAPAVFRHISDADFVHVHGIDFFYDAFAWTRPFHRKPLVATTHGGFFHTKNHAAIKKLWFQTATRASALAYDALVCCSHSDHRMFEPIAGQKARLIENGVDIDKFAALGSERPVRRMATIGRFSVNKRLDRLLDTMAALKSMSIGWQLDIVGSPSDQTEPDLRAAISTRGLQDEVHLHLGVSDAEVRGLLSQSSLFVSASEYEGFGLVAVEAMSAGLVPVLHCNDAYQALASRHSGIAVTDFSRADAAATAIEDAYQALVSSPHLRSDMMVAASQHGWSDVCDRHVALYREVLGSRLQEVPA